MSKTNMAKYFLVVGLIMLLGIGFGNGWEERGRILLIHFSIKPKTIMLRTKGSAKVTTWFCAVHGMNE